VIRLTKKDTAGWSKVIHFFSLIAQFAC